MEYVIADSQVELSKDWPASKSGKRGTEHVPSPLAIW
jgi:hypothetical protein